MPVLQILTNEANTLADTPQALFTAGARGVVIDSFTATNTSNVNASYKAYIISTAVTKPQIPFEIVIWGELDLGRGILGQLIPAGAELRLETSALDSIYFTATGHTV